MNRFASGLFTGGVLAAVGVSWIMSDTKTRKRVVRGSKRAMRKAGSFMDDVTDMFE